MRNPIPTETAISTGGAASGDPIKTSLAADQSAARKTRRKAENAFMLGMSFTFSFATCAYVPFIVNFETNTPYCFLADGALASLALVAACKIRMITILSQSLDRENLFCRAIPSYERQLKKANFRADEANLKAGQRRRNEGAVQAGRPGGKHGRPADRPIRAIEHRGGVRS